MAAERFNADRHEASKPFSAGAHVRNIRTARKSPPELVSYEAQAASTAL